MDPVSRLKLKRHLKGLFRWALFLTVLWFVVVQARAQWQASQGVEVSVNPGWLVLAGLTYLLSWIPSTWFWSHLIALLGERAPVYPLLRAYYCGSLGKYVPGKAAVIVIRSAMLKEHGVSVVRASIASAVEAAAVMLVGLVVALAFALTVLPVGALPLDLPELFRDQSTSWFALVAIVAVLVAAIPVLSVPANWLFSFIARSVAMREQMRSQTRPTDESGDESAEPSPGAPPQKLTSGFLIAASLMFAVSWAIQGLSLLLVLRSMGTDVISIDHWTVCTAAAAAGTSVGFFAVFAPGGLAVREGLIIAVLEPSMGGAIAVAGAGVLRMVSLGADCFSALVLYCVAPRKGGMTEGAEESATRPGDAVE